MPQISFSELNELIGSAGIGSVAILGFALFLDAITPLYELIESNAESNTWALFVVVPLFVFSYVAGVLCVSLGVAIRCPSGEGRAVHPDFSDMEEKLLTLVTMEYRAYRRTLDILDGSVVAFAVLAFGIVWESLAFGLPLFGAVTGCVSLLASLVCLLMARRSNREFSAFLCAAAGKGPVSP